MRTTVVLLSFCAASLAAGTPSSTVVQRDAWTPTLAGFYEVVAQYIADAKSDPSYPNPPACDLSKATMPVAPTPLPEPAGFTLSHVAVGRGTQNYTCATNNATAPPAAVGAIARLYNASCVAASYPDLLALMPSLALQYPLPSEPSANFEPPNIDLSGHHFFSTNTTPVFNLDANPASQLGIAVGKKTANSTAPAGSAGAISWLYLTATNASQGDWAAIYRVNTAGGSPPKTCEGQPTFFQVQYASEYWFYKH